MPAESCAIPLEKERVVVIEHFFGAATRAIADMKRDGSWERGGRRSHAWKQEQRARRLAAGKRVKPIRGKIGARAYFMGGIGANPSPFGLNALTELRWELTLNDHPITPQELEELLKSKYEHTQSKLVEWRGERLVVDRRQARLIIKYAPRRHAISTAEALRAVLAGETVRLPHALLSAHVYADGFVADALRRVRNVIASSASDRELRLQDFQGSLRPYQERGVQWLSLMSELGLGVCLADDMGLGKTVQVLAFLIHKSAEKNSAGKRGAPILIVCPTTVVGNWEREIARFAPGFSVVRHYGAERARTALELKQMSGYGKKNGTIVLTTYALLRRDIDVLNGVTWDTVILDEAQNVKSSISAVAKAARRLKAQHRFALTGTPVENRLTDLWSILEFTTPGLLGPLATFKRTYSAAVEKRQDDVTAQRLRGLVTPFLLRRLKSDPAIVPDLPPKQETDVLCTLTREQAALYRAAVDEAMRDIESAGGMQRRGNVLALITSLKQICNHPTHYLGDGSLLPNRSGKLTRLGEMLEEAIAEGDKVLVFTQFREMGEMIVTYLRDKFGDDSVQFLHGGTPRAARDRMVERFQNGATNGNGASGPPVFVLSLKAGGTGLNLTAANHVFHFDRWWNPAVEDQATDRAFRIGQTRPVNVYKMIAAGTLEESIADVLQGKRELAERVVSESGRGAVPAEQWLTEISNEELLGLVGLTAL